MYGAVPVSGELLERAFERGDTPALEVDYALFNHAIRVQVALVAIYAIDAGIYGILDLTWIPEGAAHLEFGHVGSDLPPCLRICPWSGCPNLVALQFASYLLEEGFLLPGVLWDGRLGGRRPCRGGFCGDGSFRNHRSHLGPIFCSFQRADPFLEGIHLVQDEIQLAGEIGVGNGVLSGKTPGNHEEGKQVNYFHGQFIYRHGCLMARTTA